MREALQDRPARQDDPTARADLVAVLTASRWLTASLVLLSGIFIYLQVFAFPCTPRLASGDQAIYLHPATRMLDGEMIYRDYDHFTLPGTDVVYAAPFNCFGVRAWIPQTQITEALTALAVKPAYSLRYGSDPKIPATFIEKVLG